MANLRSDTSRVTSELSACGSHLTIRVYGPFNFNLHRDFLDSYSSLPQPPTRFSIDLAEATHLDSAALGMLLLLRDHCFGAEVEVPSDAVTLLNANEHVATILEVSNFDQLFDIR
ncbi:STAS domain-containing protein [Microbulbifer guangxiensis]|uniref:STAS domain-containing protein n=1 Tax=Microbulbifer guangxiensis TaxID=2904249 RepID=UPI001F324DB7|nr:STAS domain-containing protein [Microbulbifer guangxiensis]